MHRTLRALLSAAAAALSATTVLVGLAAGPAQAQSYDSLPLKAWAYTDKAQPSTADSNPSGDYLIGSSKDAAGVKHTGRAYFTFDLTPLKGQVLHRVTFYTYEQSVVDCTQPAPIDVWRTKPVTSGTDWQHAPKELELLDHRDYGKGAYCPGAYLGVDMIPAVQAAFARGEKSLTVEVRVNASAEGDAKVGRTMSKGVMSYGANHAPTVSGLKLKYPDAGCGTLEKHPSAGTWVQVQATVKDLDPNDYATITYAYWPVDQPGRRQTTYGPVDISGYADGTVVAWSAQGKDYDDAGPWGRTCYFTVDKTAPATKPIVSSKQYPSNDYPGTGGPGVPGTFVFDSSGDHDIVGFDWSPEDGSLLQHVRANHPGGRAKVSITPRQWGGNRIQVASVDAAGNRGPFVEYHYEVRNTAPFAEVEINGVGLTSHITLSSPAADVTGFGWAVDGGAETRVPAVDGKGHGDLVFDSVGPKTVVERAYAGKKLIGSHSDYLSVTDAPKIDTDDFDFWNTPISGVAGTFTFSPRTQGVVSYRYDFGDGNQQSIDAGPDGTAVLPWTPPTGGYYSLTVYSIDGNGNRSQGSIQQFSVTDVHPTVYANTYGSHVGDPVDVTASSNLPNAVGLVYTFDGGPEQTVDSSWADFTVVPTHAGDSIVSVRARLDDGTFTPATDYPLHIDSGPLITTKGPYGADPVAGLPLSITFTAVQGGATSFRYTVANPWDGQDHPEQTVAAGPDGTATVTITAPDTDITVTVTSVTADGTASDTGTDALRTLSPQVVVDNPWQADYAESTGGLGVPGQFGFAAYDLGDITATYLWHVNDGPVREVAPDPNAWETKVDFTPDFSGDATLYVQREFTDGSRSAVQAIPFKVGTHPLITSDVYQPDAPSGGAGQAGSFRFSGGMPGIASYTYQFLPDNRDADPAATVDAAADGSAQVTYTPSQAGSVTVLVRGITADGRYTDQAGYRFDVAG
jgi:hypothetical protein